MIRELILLALMCLGIYLMATTDDLTFDVLMVILIIISSVLMIIRHMKFRA